MINDRILMILTSLPKNIVPTVLLLVMPTAKYLKNDTNVRTFLLQILQNKLCDVSCKVPSGRFIKQWELPANEDPKTAKRARIAFFSPRASSLVVHCPA